MRKSSGRAMGTGQMTPLIGSLGGQSKDRQMVEIYGHIDGDFGIYTRDLGGRDPRGFPEMQA